MEQRKILVTSALPYANGPIHIGHLVEYIQTDIWVRFQKMGGHECYYICASDAHGTPIMLRAEEEKIPAEELIKAVSADQQEDFSDFAIQFDNFHTTHSKENKEIVERIYESLVDNGYIKSRMVEQFYDPVKNMFLPDRFIRGTCPSCRAEDQYGDSCEKCGATYSPLDLIDPKSSLTSVQPEIRESNHLFFTLGSFTDVLKRWMVENQLHANVKNKLEEWFDVGLKDWDISRDEPYFGFEIPDQPGKYFYVWLDAPIGYLGSLKNFCDKNEMDFESLTREPQAAEMYHFVGKDIMYFHTLFWPALLSASGFNLPKSVFVHGFLTINGQKMSKS
ncbi:MAG: methionine--tRNA ligase, partial [Pseudomonadota bacterium]|nr:methionine--tRNA ligase [Pseudomonadota bacterium]